jgi:SNF2 family DNA or RNA helicase
MIKFVTTPYEHQRREVEAARRGFERALFWEMGTGKTKGMIDILRDRFTQEKRVMKTLILGPKVILRNWKDEFAIHSKIFPKDILVLTGPGKRRCKDLLEAVQTDEGRLSRGKIVITNYESMEMDDLVAMLEQWAPEILVCDESHRCKSPDSKRAKKVAKLSDLTKWRYIMTGTPILNSAMDVFMQYRILDGGKTFGNNFYAFQHKYFEDENAGWRGKQGYFPKYVPRPETYGELNVKLYRKASRVLKKDCLDLPPLTKQRILVELGPEQSRMYREMEQEYLTYVEAELEKGEPAAVVAQLAITKALRLQQIVSGFAKTDEGVEHQIGNNPRLEALRDLLEELTLQGPVIVWACFKKNYEMIETVCKKLKLTTAMIHGGIKDKDAEAKKFRSGKAQVMIANQAAGGIGINLVEAPNSIFYSRNFSLEQDLQAEARNYRGGSQIHERITRIDIISAGTIDELVAEALQAKEDIAKQVLGWRKRMKEMSK